MVITKAHWAWAGVGGWGVGVGGLCKTWFVVFHFKTMPGIVCFGKDILQAFSVAYLYWTMNPTFQQFLLFFFVWFVCMTYQLEGRSSSPNTNGNSLFSSHKRPRLTFVSNSSLFCLLDSRWPPAHLCAQHWTQGRCSAPIMRSLPTVN